MDEVPSDEDSELLVRLLCDRIPRTRTSEMNRRKTHFFSKRKKRK